MNNKTKKEQYMRSHIASAFFAATLAMNAHGATVQLSATIDDIGQNYFGGGVVDFFQAGETVIFSFSYTLDDSIPAGDANGMKYVVTDFHIDSPAYSATVLNRGAIKFTNTDGYDSFSMYSGYSDLTQSYGVPLPDVPLLNGYYLSSLGFTLGSSTGAFSSDSLNQPLMKDAFDSFNFYFAFREPGSTRAMGTMQSWHLTSLTSSISPVPEASSALLFGLGILVLLLRPFLTLRSSGPSKSCASLRFSPSA